MPDWIQLLTQNGTWLYPLAALVTILTGVEILYKPFRWGIPKLWDSWIHWLKTKQVRITLRFVAMASHWQESGCNNKPSVTIVTIWRITRVPVPGSELPALLFNARLLGPLSKYLLNPQITVTGGTRREDSILPGETRNVQINCLVSKIPKPDEVLNVRLVIEDQLANKHKLPPVLVKPATMGK
jgi:hypothetical protein